MSVIWKFRLPMPTDHVMEVVMPERASVVSVQLQHGIPTMWAACSPSNPEKTRFFRWIATGETFADTTLMHFTGSRPPSRSDLAYLATLQFGALVFHLFEEIRS